MGASSPRARSSATGAWAAPWWPPWPRCTSPARVPARRRGWPRRWLLQTLQGPGERYCVGPGRRHRGAVRKAARRLLGALRLTRRHLRKAPPPGPRGVQHGGNGYRLRRGRPEARLGRRRGRHGIVRLLAGLPAGDSLARGGECAARRLGRPPGHRPHPRRGLPRRRVAALRRPLDAQLHAQGWLPAAQARVRDRLAGVPWARRRHRDGRAWCRCSRPQARSCGSPARPCASRTRYGGNPGASRRRG